MYKYTKSFLYQKIITNFVKNISMSSFWYHSPIRFYRSLSELTDKRNPQNAQYFGAEYPYQLEIGVIQNILIK